MYIFAHCTRCNMMEIQKNTVSYASNGSSTSNTVLQQHWNEAMRSSAHASVSLITDHRANQAKLMENKNKNIFLLKKKPKMKLRRTSHMVRCLEWSNSHSFSSLLVVSFNAPANTSAKNMNDNSKKRLRLRYSNPHRRLVMIRFSFTLCSAVFHYQCVVYVMLIWNNE